MLVAVASLSYLPLFTVKTSAMFFFPPVPILLLFRCAVHKERFVSEFIKVIYVMEGL
jgi:hypothetical protein